MDDLQRALRQVPLPLQVAFAAGVAERVLRIYEFDCGTEDKRLATGVEVAWRFACGDKGTEDTVEETIDAVTTATPRIEEQGDHLTAAMFACISVLSALEAIDDPTGESAARAATNALDAVDVFVESFTEQQDSTEQQWQERALQIIGSWGNHPIRRNMFVSDGEQPPNWFRWASELQSKLGDRLEKDQSN